MKKLENIVVSPCCNPELELEEAFTAYTKAGYRAFEVFTSWVRSAFDYTADPQQYLEVAARFGVRLASFHLPMIEADDVRAGLAESIKAARFAAALGVKVVLFKASDRPTIIQAAGEFLDAIDDLTITPVLQNHYGTAISSLDDFREVIEGIDDSRMRSLLEVGHFHTAGVSWKQGCDLLGDSIALIHIKDQIGAQSVPFGAGEIDLPGLFAFMEGAGYQGDYVVEMEVKDRENTLQYLTDALTYLKSFCEGQ